MTHRVHPILLRALLRNHAWRTGYVLASPSGGWLRKRDKK